MRWPCAKDDGRVASYFVDQYSLNNVAGIVAWSPHMYKAGIHIHTEVFREDIGEDHVLFCVELNIGKAYACATLVAR